MQGNINGVGMNLLLGFGATVGQFLAVPPDGILLDPNAGITISGQIGSTQEAGCIYDIVPA